MKVIILAGGRGTRLGDVGATIPKALVEVGGKPIVQHQIDLLEAHGFSDIRFALGFRAEQIVDFLRGRYEYVIEKEPLGTGGAVRFATRDLTESFMVMNGDIISDVDVSSFAAAHTPGTHQLVVAHHKENTDFGLIHLDKEGRIERFLEKPEIPTSGYVNVGLYLLEPSAFEGIESQAFSIEYDVFPRLAAQGKLRSFKHEGFWHDLGTEHRLHRVRQLFDVWYQD